MVLKFSKCFEHAYFGSTSRGPSSTWHPLPFPRTYFVAFIFTAQSSAAEGRRIGIFGFYTSSSAAVGRSFSTVFVVPLLAGTARAGAAGPRIHALTVLALLGVRGGRWTGAGS